ncbi:MAG TPA: winged helix-turn-helix domain-containing protein [Candidatus Solibacter sp.]|nr:winged helix-turn-helix domain-containing protein [Candidatus Solibacter sp.]
MQAPPEKSRVVRFGLFEVDLQESELRKNGTRIRLQEQPFQILTMLLGRPGETVTREELRRRLWPVDTFVDFDHNLNSSIKKLRQALGDDSENPRFIETLHRRGYRFIAPVDGSGTPAVAQEAQSPGGVAPRPTVKRRFETWQKWLAGAFIIALALFAALWWPSSVPRVRAYEQLTDDGVRKSSLVTDGNRIYYTTNYGTNYGIGQVSARGGQPAAMDVPMPNLSLDGLSPDLSELIVEQNTTELGNWNHQLWAVPLPAGSPRRLGDLRGHDAVWAPDGRLMFAKGNELYVAGPDGQTPHKFASTPGFPTAISFSPDGTRIRLTIRNPADVFIGPSELWEIRSDGTDMHPLLRGWNNPPSECCGHWTPGGEDYIFQSTRNGSTNIWILPDRPKRWKKNPHEPIQLTIGPLQLSDAIPSRDGKKLFAVGTHQRAELVRYESRTGQFIPYLGGISAGDVDFSRDGKWVTYVSYPEGTLWRSQPDGSERLQLTYPPLLAALAHWSPDGKQIAFSGTTPGKPWKVFLVARDGGNARAATSDEFQELDPTWSPDGKTLAFGHYHGLDPSQTFIELVHIDTNQISELPGSRGIYAPRWSPDGRYIIAISHDSQKLMLYDVQRQEWHQVASAPPAYGYLAWSRDSAYVYFDATSGTGFYRLRITDAHLEKVVDLRIQRFPDQFSGSWCGLGPADELLLARDITTQEIYALDLQLP